LFGQGGRAGLEKDRGKLLKAIYGCSLLGRTDCPVKITGFPIRYNVAKSQHFQKDNLQCCLHQQKKKVTPGRTLYSLCVRRCRRIEGKLAFWVCGLILEAGGQGSMPPGRTRPNQGLRRHPTQKGSPDAKRFSGRNPIG